MVETQTRLDQALQENQHRTSDPVKTLAKSGYIVGDVIGQGTFATVKTAYWSKLKAKVAIKILSKTSASAHVAQKHVPRELEVIRTLRHPNIIHFYEIIETNMRYYIVMQYGENGTLLELMRTNRTLAEPRVRRYYGQIIGAIQYMHSCGFVHRDIKLENVVLDAKDQVKLIDFGFACRVRDEGTTLSSLIEPYLSTTFCGSHAYASPEILQMKPYDPIPADIWASTVIIYALLFGRLPFTNSKNTKLLQQIIAKGVQFPSTITVTDEVKALMKQIFVPVRQRVTTAYILCSQWFLMELTETK
ncbi:testis-specific serine/threonine-protein kinase 4-like [Anopheles funestus]|uniref:testis-specific serine/threonine-protein kinase 4-like n=1 Tax=Anopheles funestus TaxID=62324 RepID=UPI0020C6EEE8|nr:testis-specific serine/threonine-protein kinase 4-like [Anopheles funestus]